MHRGLGPQRIALHMLHVLAQDACHGTARSHSNLGRQRALLCTEREERNQERKGPQPKGRAGPLTLGGADLGLRAHPLYEAYRQDRRKRAPDLPQ